MNRKIHFHLPLLTLLMLATCFQASVFGAEAENHAVAPSKLSERNSSSSNPVLKGKLVFATVIFRHGDRMIMNPYPNDPYGSRDKWPWGWGQLTNIGKYQHYQLGQWLRKRYDSLLGPAYSEDKIYIRSTDVDRTLMSALANLAGLYPPDSAETWNKKLEWQPIPVHTVPENLDMTLAGKAPCAAYEYALSALKNSAEFQKLNDRYVYLYDYLSEHSGATVRTLEDVQRINNTFFIEELYNKSLPEWTKKVYPSSDMTYISQLTFAVQTYTRQMARLKTGPLIKEILKRFADKATGKLQPDRNIWIYSAHDTTVANVLNTLKLFELHSPPYTACILMELHIDDNNEPFISIFYKNTTAEPAALNIPHCGTTCPLNQMYKLYKDILPGNWEHECKLSKTLKYEEANIGVATAMLISIILVMMCFSYIGTIYYRRLSFGNYSSYAQMA